jgi:hypothetical protein
VDCHLALVPDKNTMLYWLAHACREARLAHVPKIKALDIASRVRDYVPRRESVDNSTISRFEKGVTWPRTPMDAIVAAYAVELELEPIQLWQEALRLWHAHLGGREVSRATEAAVAKPRPAGDAKIVRAGRARRRAG